MGTSTSSDLLTKGAAKARTPSPSSPGRLTPEQKVERLEAYLRRRGKVGEMEIAEAYGEEQP